jgi:hypothetical protein
MIFLGNVILVWHNFLINPLIMQEQYEHNSIVNKWTKQSIRLFFTLVIHIFHSSDKRFSL